MDCVGRKSFGAAEHVGSDVVIRPDLEKLDLSEIGLISLDDLRAADSGRVSGPKGAKLGELKHLFGDKVPNGFVIPFGVFRRVLDKPIQPDGVPAFEWMIRQYDEIAAADEADQPRMVSTFLARLRDHIENVEFDAAFRDEVRTMLKKSFGADGDLWGLCSQRHQCRGPSRLYRRWPQSDRPQRRRQ